MRHLRDDTEKVYYCHTPPRYLYDFRSKYLSSLPFLIRPIFSLAFDIFGRIYERHLAGFDRVFSNSENVAKRLLDFTKTSSEIIYPPTDTSRFAPVKNTEALNLKF
jgi:glycosyltransferase involved in cell wall biosynthesis